MLVGTHSARFFFSSASPCEVVVKLGVRRVHRPCLQLGRYSTIQDMDSLHQLADCLLQFQQRLTSKDL